MFSFKVAPHILSHGVVPNICQKHVHRLPDLPHSDNPFKIWIIIIVKSRF